MLERLDEMYSCVSWSCSAKDFIENLKKDDQDVDQEGLKILYNFGKYTQGL